MESFKTLLAVGTVGLTALVASGCGNGAATLSGSHATSSTAPGTSSATAPSTTATTDASQALQVVGSGFTQLPPDSIGNSYVSTAAVLKWSGSGEVAEDVEATLTLKNAAGTVVNSDQETVAAIFPGQTVAVANSAQVSGATTLTVQTLVTRTEPYSNTPPAITTSSVSTASPDGYTQQTNGTVTSTASKELQNLDAVAVYYNSAGAILGGDYTFINFVPANGNTSFQVSGTNVIPDIASTQVYVSVSSLTLSSLSGS